MGVWGAQKPGLLCVRMLVPWHKRYMHDRLYSPLNSAQGQRVKRVAGEQDLGDGLTSSRTPGPSSG